MQRQVQPKKEEKGPLMQIKLGGAPKSSASSGGGFKKGGFKNAFGPTDDDSAQEVKKPDEAIASTEGPAMNLDDSDITDDEDYYDPRRPTGCLPDCKGHNVAIS